jgi:hypothetical protein
MLTNSYHPEYTDEHYSLSKEVEEHLANNNHEGLMQVTMVTKVLLAAKLVDVSVTKGVQKVDRQHNQRQEFK